MKFNMVQCLNAFSLALDFVTMDYFKVALHHSRKVAYISLNIGKALNLPEEDMKDLYALALLHDNGFSLAGLRLNRYHLIEDTVDHCEEGEKNLKAFPLFKKREKVILYHHENYDGSGYFKVSGNDIPLLSQIIHLADRLDMSFDLSHLENAKRTEVIEFTQTNKGILFSPAVVDAFLTFSHKERFWCDLLFYNINEVLQRIAPEISYEYTWKDIIPVTETLMRIIDSKSKFTYRHSKGISEKILVMSDYYMFHNEKKLKLYIAANLHDLGKLYLPNSILDKPDRLESLEYNEVMKHTYFTKLALDSIEGFEDISRWAANHHEKLNGRGYPECLKGGELDFESRLMGVIDIYQALTEDRPYRMGLPHDETMKILYTMADSGYIDGQIVKDVDVQHFE